MTEGEDLLEAGLAAGAEPRFLLSRRPGCRRWGGEEVEPELLAAVSALGSGTRAIAVWPLRLGRARRRRPASTCTGSATPATSARSSAPPHALLGGTVVARPRLRRPVLAEGGAGQHGLDLRRGRRCGPSWRRRRRRGRPWSPTAAPASRRSPGAATLCLGAEREGLPARGARRVRGRGDDPAAAGRRRVAQRRRRGGDRLRADIVARHAGGRSPMLERIEEIRAEAAAAIAAPPATRRAGGAAGPLPRPQSRADDDPARDRRAAAGGTGQGRRRRQPGPQGAGGAARGARRAARRRRAGEPAGRRPGRRHPARGAAAAGRPRRT